VRLQHKTIAATEDDVREKGDSVVIVVVQLPGHLSSQQNKVPTRVRIWPPLIGSILHALVADLWQAGRQGEAVVSISPLTLLYATVATHIAEEGSLIAL
jgi:hypothetical protein